MKYRALIRSPGGVVRIRKARLEGGVFKTRVNGKKTVFSWDDSKTFPYGRGRKTFTMALYDPEISPMPIDPPFESQVPRPETDQTRALRHLAEYAESRAIEALGKPPAEMLYVLIFMLVAALGTGILVYFAVKTGSPLK